tara:strand:+ start:768 stop:1076 length:309 start_codon:yes stop_codon:yes gene_type:complete
MKEIKTLLIGFLSCLCLILIMGQTKESSLKYQFIVERRSSMDETFYLYNNETEDIQILQSYQSGGEKKWTSSSLNYRALYNLGIKNLLEEQKNNNKSTIIGK